MGVVSLSGKKKWSDQNPTGLTASYGPATTNTCTKCICVVMFAGAHEAISHVVWCQISEVDSSLSLGSSCYRSHP